jgi:Na+-transporting NADH:ubiquinone oxidoreductase subunit NqrB
MTTAAARSLRLGDRDYPVLLPSWRDPRLHLAAVIISIHTLGQVALGFRVSVPQIITAIATCAVIEVAWTFHAERRIVWPASAMLTGSGVGLILRLVGMERGETWSWDGWWLFALVAGFSLASKYVIRWRGSHLFNPSNFGLVVAFAVLGSDVIEPLDFWWAPLGSWLVLSYLIIVVGGLAITSRLRLLPMAFTFWLVFASLLGVLSTSGHCMTTAWAIQPVCGSDFWSAVAFSPEVLIFLFFMITDPKTIPHGRLARIVFAASVAGASTLLLAPQTQEFGAKVGLLAGLVVLTPLRGLFDVLLPEGRRDPSPRYLFGVGAAAGSGLVLTMVGIVAAGAPSRGDGPPAGQAASVEVRIDASTLPPVEVSDEVAALNSDVASRPEHLATALAEALAIEGEAMLRQDTSLLRSADAGERLLERERAVESAATQGDLVVAGYEFDELLLDVAYTDGPQGGASLVLEGSGTVHNVSYDLARVEQGRTSAPFQSSFVMSQGSDGQWLITRVGPG